MNYPPTITRKSKAARYLSNDRRLTADDILSQLLALASKKRDRV